MKFALRILTAFVLICAALHTNAANAACSNPTGVEGQIVFNETSKIPQYCDNTNWIAMVGGDPTPAPDCPAGITSCGGQTDERVVFLTSPINNPSTTNTYNKCASEAAAAGLKGTYYAWYASTDEDDPESVYEKSRVPYVKVDGVKVADDWADLTDGTIDSSIDTFASGDSGGSTNGVWTFVLPDGTYAGDSTCTTNLSSGLRNTTSSGWTTGTGSGSCSNGKRLYCFEQGQPTTKIVPNGLLGHWRLDETSGTTVYDSSGNGYGGTMIGGPTSIPNTVIGNGRNFGNGDRIDITHGGALDNLNQFTISAWVFRENNGAGAQGRIMAMPGNFMLSLWNNSIRFTASRWSGNEGGWRNGADLPSGQWHHYVVTYDYSSTTNIPNVYFNGEPYNLSRTSAPTGSPTNVSSTLNLGNDPSGLWLRNTLDDVRIYNRIISPDEVAAIYAARDGIRYNENYRAPEYFDGNQFVTMPAPFPEPGDAPVYGCKTIGETCSDGTIHAGLSPDDNQPIFATPTDAPGGAAYSWNAGNASGASMVAVTADACYSSGQTGCKTGELNTNDAATADSDSITAGIQDHEAAKYCDGLSSNGYDDWYLPAQEELALLYTNRSVGDLSGTFATSYPEHTYWTSSEVNDTAVQIYSFDGSGGNNATKENTWSVRCIRKGSYELAGTAGLVGHWKFDEKSGNTIKDYGSSGKDLAWTDNNNNDLSEESNRGAIAGSLNSINGIAKINTIGDQDFYLSPTDSMTISLWFKTDAPTTALFNSSAGSMVSTIILDGGRLRPRVRDSNNVFLIDTYIASNLNDESWHFASVVVNRLNNRIKTYIDGIELDDRDVSSATGNIGIPSNTGISIAQTARNTNIDDVRFYNRALSAAEITQIFQMGTPVGSVTALPEGCPNIGDVCDDGTVYAGLSPDGDVEMFTTPNDGPTVPWNNGNSSGRTLVGTDDTAGYANTQIIISTDADSSIAGFQPHQAAQYCWDLQAHGYGDWYLPSEDEVYRFYQYVTAIKNFTISGSVYYWSSTEGSGDSTNRAFRKRLSDPYGTGVDKNTSNSRLRCVRKGPAPRCANPYGLEGQIIYNSTHDVAQYCDGARWVSIGKDN
ncbi:MAG: DUF1566 domain-containing protein [Alphaproteobacteria bacterium]|nr:DUF1566 domain-containing protein [Alphaproteobacteria bacterium]